jgi:predicted flap endonuclease-1-like 5' DNA nuclease
MIMKTSDIEGIGNKYAGKLAKAGIRSVEALLKKGASPKGRKELAASSGISDTLILEWVNLADLFRVKGVGTQYSDLLEEAGVDTIVELAKRVPENLYKKMQEVNTAKNLVNKLPGVKQVTNWVKQAKSLPRIVTY